ncbi:MAG: ferrous iron transport protein A [Desulfobacca sp.]|nr:ferrous iron transport protein A [Desulfobacca sp.]OPX18817.1 MAG: hypothetical protein BZ151_12645 [Desulfobacca sp. 4484_104]RLA87838.1 MAG: iron transporter FeoA [Deltaproteobacteria bacterium]
MSALVLNSLKKGQKARITGITNNSDLKRRLLKMGLVRGEIIEVERVAPLGDPIDVVVKGYHLSLRQEEAKLVEVEVA